MKPETHEFLMKQKNKHRFALNTTMYIAHFQCLRSIANTTTVIVLNYAYLIVFFSTTAIFALNFDYCTYLVFVVFEDSNNFFSIVFYQVSFDDICKITRQRFIH